MRRVLFVLTVTTVLVLGSAVPALAAHCINQSKPDGAGNHGYILLNTDEEVVFISDGALNGGFGDVYVDFNANQQADAGELVVEDTFIAKNHSPQQGGEPFVVPGAFHNPSDQGIGLAH